MAHELESADLNEPLCILNITTQVSLTVHKILSLTRIYLKMKFHTFSPQNHWLIDHFRMEVLRSYSQRPGPKVPDSEPSPTHCWYPLITASHASSIWGLKSLRIQSCDPMCQIRKTSSLFGTLGHKQNNVTCDHTRLRVPVSLIGCFGHYNSKFYFLC